MRRSLSLSAICLSFTFSACTIEGFADGERFQADFHYSFPLKAGGDVNVDTFNGSIEIVGWDQDNIDISGNKHALTQELLDAIKIDTMHNEGSVSVHAVRPFDSHGNMGANFVIHVPKRANLERIVTSNGHIQVRSIAGNANLRTSNGPIDADEVDGPIDASTSNGRITVVESLDSGKAPIHVRTSNGAINITARKPTLSDLHASTSNGAITLHLPDSISARVRASTSNSSITSDFDVTGSSRRDKHHLEGTIHGSASDTPMIDLSTSNGPIRLSKL